VLDVDDGLLFSNDLNTQDITSKIREQKMEQNSCECHAATGDDDDDGEAMVVCPLCQITTKESA
jgi:hypothetical protein